LTTRKKLIEVALPLEAINIASAREKSIRHGHPSTLHLWWARRPLAAARAVIFAQMVDDPSAWPDLFPTEKKQEQERQRLFRIIEDLVKWENTTNEEVLQKARDEIWRSWRRACAENVGHPQAKELFDRDKLPAFHDPFAGGGALPLEAQRLGLEAYASDLNPVAVLINKAMIEIPPKFAGKPPVNPQVAQTKTEWKGAEGLAEDVRYYGKWMRDEAEKRIGHLYPKVKVTAEMVEERPDLLPYLDKELTVIAWIWARTVKSPNPAFRDSDVPLVSTFLLSTKSGKEAYVQPIVENGDYRFTVRVGKPEDLEAVSAGTKAEGRGANFSCLMSGSPISGEYVKQEGTAGRIGERLMTIVAEGERGRVYLAPTPEHMAAARLEREANAPRESLPKESKGRTAFWCVLYGLKTWGDLFTNRQLMALTTFSDLVAEAREHVRADAELSDNGDPKAYSDAVATYLALGASRASDAWSSIVGWRHQAEASRNTFARQAIPMTWDFTEVNPFSDSNGNWMGNSIQWVQKSLIALPATPTKGIAIVADAASQSLTNAKVCSTDPPYYDNIGYADLSDFFYVWLRRTLRQSYPDLFATIAAPKDQELVATPYRHGGKEAAEKFFLDGMTEAMRQLCGQSHPAFPVSIYYAFKQAESTDSGGQASTGWETFLEAVIRSGFALTGTWPMRTEKEGRAIGNGANALASSIILVCRKREASAPEATRREFLLALEKELAAAVADLQRGNVAPVDMQQAAIGPGMAIFTRYSQVLDADGKPLGVREALTLINQALDEVLAHQEGDFDSDTRWALAWFEQFGFTEGDYGIAETLSKAKNTSVEGIRLAGIGTHGKGKVRLFKPEELTADWNPDDDKRLTVWDMVHHLIRTLEQGEEVAAGLLAQLGTRADIARELAYRLYSICERKKRSADALRYNALVQSWPELIRLAQQAPPKPQGSQPTLEGMN
jgi:putative DNA methylase